MTAPNPAATLASRATFRTPCERICPESVTPNPPALDRVPPVLVGAPRRTTARAGLAGHRNARVPGCGAAVGRGATRSRARQTRSDAAYRVTGGGFHRGQPTLLGQQTHAQAFGDGYVDALRGAYQKLPDSIDYVMYWWTHAAAAVASGQTVRAGLITTPRGDHPSVPTRQVPNLAAEGRVHHRLRDADGG